MQPQKIVSREEWIAARKAHLAHEKEYTRARDRLSETLPRDLTVENLEPESLWVAASDPHPNSTADIALSKAMAYRVALATKEWRASSATRCWVMSSITMSATALSSLRTGRME